MSKKAKFVVTCIGHSLWEGGAVMAFTWLIVGPKPLALVIGAVIGVGTGIITAVESQ